MLLVRWFPHPGSRVMDGRQQREACLGLQHLCLLEVKDSWAVAEVLVG